MLREIKQDSIDNPRRNYTSRKFSNELKTYNPT
jgi:hypothetical protein